MNSKPQVSPIGVSEEPNETQREPWVKPEIVSFKPVSAAQGISYMPLDGLSNLTA